MAVGHLGITVNLQSFKTIELGLSGRIDSFLDFPGGLPGFAACQVPVLDRGNLDVDVDSIHERPRDLGAIALNLWDRTGAFIVGIAVITAGAGVHGCDQHEASRVGEGGRCTGDGHPFLFQGLTQDFQDILLEFGQFVQEKNAVVGEADFPGFRDLSSSNEARIGNRVVGASKRSGHNEGAIGRDQSHHTMDFCRFKTFLKIHIRKDRGNHPY